jgi:hypothetical protein
MNDEELEQLLRVEIQDLVQPPYAAPDSLRRRVWSLQMMEPVRSGSGRGLPRAFRKPRVLVAAAAIALLVASSVLLRQSLPRPANSVTLPATFEMFGRLDASSAWVEDGADLYITRDGGASWTKGTVPGGRSFGAALQSGAAQGATEPASTGSMSPGYDHLYPMFVDSDHGWLLSWTVSGATECDAGDWTLTLWRTTDGAVSWQSSQLPGTYKGYGSVEFTDTRHGWVTVNRINTGVLCPPQEGGSAGIGPVTPKPVMESATPEPTATPAPLPSDTTKVLATSDGGVTWTSISSLTDAPQALHFVDTSEAWGCTFVNDANTVSIFIVHSTDGGRSWTKAILPLPDGDNLEEIDAQPTEDGGTASLRAVAYQSQPSGGGVTDAPGGGFTSSTYVILTFVSGDRGQTWKLDATRAIPGDFPNLLGGFFGSGLQAPAGQPIAAIDNSFLQGSGPPESFQASFDGGVSWQSYSTIGLPWSVGMAEWASPDDVWVLSNGGQSVASGVPGYLYTTQDGGKTWTGLGDAPKWPASPQPTVTPYTNPVQPTAFPLVPQSTIVSMGRVDAKVGWVHVQAPDGDVLQMTTDGGATWTEPRPLPVDPDTFMPAGDVQFVDENRGWAVSASQDAVSANHAASVSTAGPDYRIAVFRTVDGGKSWQRSTIDLGEWPSSPGNYSNDGYGQWTAVHFRDAKHGEVYSTFGWSHTGTALPGDALCQQASTDDGGVTWSAPKDGPCVSQITFNGSGEGYGQSWDGGPTIYVTSDEGQTWVSGTLPSAQSTPDNSGPTTTSSSVERHSDGSLSAMTSSSDGAVDRAVSKDGGRTWVSSGAGSGLSGAGDYTFAWLGAGHWLALDTTVSSFGEGSAAETVDGGITWYPIATTGLQGAIGDVSFVSPTDGWLVGGQVVCPASQGGSEWCQTSFDVIATPDGGQTWNTILSPEVAVAVG